MDKSTTGMQRPNAQHRPPSTSAVRLRSRRPRLYRSRAGRLQPRRQAQSCTVLGTAVPRTVNPAAARRDGHPPRRRGVYQLGRGSRRIGCGDREVRALRGVAFCAEGSAGGSGAVG